MRKSKTVGATTTNFVWDGQNMVYEYKGSNTTGGTAYYYGLTLISQGNYAYYLYNGHGDVVQLVMAGGTLGRSYDYDAFGNEVSPSSSDTNPFRYAGQYFDSETGTYYLRARYYDPAIGRFTQRDTHWNVDNMIYGDNPSVSQKYRVPDFISIIQSSNLYLYCMDNPILFIDASGHSFEDAKEYFELIMAEAALLSAIAKPAYVTCAGIAAVDGPAPVGDAIALGGALLVSLGVLGYSTYRVIAKESVFPNIQEKVEEKEDEKVAELSDTVIYRYNGTNPSNLTPKGKDVFTGLSFSTIPKAGAAMTTIGALNSTGIVYAVQDGPTHVSVRPVGASVQDWIMAGSQSIWTQAVRSVVKKVG